MSSLTVAPTMCARDAYGTAAAAFGAATVAAAAPVRAVAAAAPGMPSWRAANAEISGTHGVTFRLDTKQGYQVPRPAPPA